MTTNKPDFSTACADFKAARLLYWQMSSENAEKLHSYYSAEYDRAEVGEISFGEDVYREIFTDLPPMTANVVRDYRNALIDNILHDYVAQYTREEFVGIFNLLLRGLGGAERYVKIKLADCVEIPVTDLMRAWNEMHPDELEIMWAQPVDIG